MRAAHDLLLLANLIEPLSGSGLLSADVMIMNTYIYLKEEGDCLRFPEIKQTAEPRILEFCL